MAFVYRKCNKNFTSFLEVIQSKFAMSIFSNWPYLLQFASIVFMQLYVVCDQITEDTVYCLLQFFFNVWFIYSCNVVHTYSWTGGLQGLEQSSLKLIPLLVNMLYIPRQNGHNSVARHIFCMQIITGMILTPSEKTNKFLINPC